MGHDGWRSTQPVCITQFVNRTNERNAIFSHPSGHSSDCCRSCTNGDSSATCTPVRSITVITSWRGAHLPYSHCTRQCAPMAHSTDRRCSSSSRQEPEKSLFVFFRVPITNGSLLRSRGEGRLRDRYCSGWRSGRRRACLQPQGVQEDSSMGAVTCRVVAREVERDD